MDKKLKLIADYKKKMDVIDRVLDDVDRNIKLAKKEKEINKDILYEMIQTRNVFLSKWSCYEQFIKELTNLN